MRIGVVGIGAIGSRVGQLLATAGHEVTFTGSRSKAKLRAAAEAAGPTARTAGLSTTVARAEVVVLAVPYDRFPDLADELGSALVGKIAIDTSNPLALRGDEVVSLHVPDGLTAAEYQQRRLGEVRLVKAFSAFCASQLLELAAHPVSERVAMPYGGDDPEAKRVVAGLIADAGFVLVDLGRLADTGSPTPARWTLRYRLETRHEEHGFLPRTGGRGTRPGEGVSPPGWRDVASTERCLVLRPPGRGVRAAGAERCREVHGSRDHRRDPQGHVGRGPGARCRSTPRAGQGEADHRRPAAVGVVLRPADHLRAARAVRLVLPEAPRRRGAARHGGTHRQAQGVRPAAVRRAAAPVLRRGGSGQRPGRDLPRRADHWSGPPDAAQPVGARTAVEQRRGQDGGAHHALHGRGRAARRPYGHHRPRRDPGDRYAARADRTAERLRAGPVATTTPVQTAELAALAGVAEVVVGSPSTCCGPSC